MDILSVVMLAMLVVLEGRITDADPSDSLKWTQWDRQYNNASILFNSAVTLPDAASATHCTTFCSGSDTWCNAIGWTESTGSCKGYTRVILEEAIPADISHVYISDKVICIGDGYVSGGGFCVKYDFNMALSWAAAEVHCGVDGGRLVVANTQEKYDYLHGELYDTYGDGDVWWIGAIKVGEVWQWTTGDTTVLAGMNVDGDNTMAECLESANGYVYDRGCADPLKFICEK